MIQIPSSRCAIAALLILSGCGSTTKPEQAAPGQAPAAPRAPTTRPSDFDTSGNRGLPGPPPSTPVPTSTDPVERALEDRLFRTDGGRVVLKGIRAHGGWKRWLEVTEIQATLKEVPVKGADGAAAPATATAKEPLAVVHRSADPAAIPATEEERILTAPFWLSSPQLSLEYMGVESASATGDTLDKVQVFQTTPGSDWWIAYFNRHTGILERLLRPAFTRDDPLRFQRVDLRAPRQVEELWFSTLWATFSLEGRFTRPDLRRPDRLQEAEIRVARKPAESPAPTSSN